MDFTNCLPDLSGGHIFDTHAHYDDAAFEQDRDDLLESMHAYGVSGIVTCACNKSSAVSALELAHRYDFIYAAVGMHPENTDEGFDEEWIRAGLEDGRCVAVGEIGLDYHWNKPNDLDKEIFIRQLELAKEYGKPVIVHDRDAHGDTLDILQLYRPSGVVHCFSGSAEMAKQIVSLGMFIGIGGVVTFKNARKSAEVVKVVPLEKILLETDAPYMAPVPFRGQRCNSAMIGLVAEKIALLKECSVREVLDITEKNARRLFKI